MAITITKTTNLRYKLVESTDPTHVKYIPTAGCVIMSKGHDVVSIAYDGVPFSGAIDIPITNLTAPGNTSIGAATFAHATDRWTRSTHGLVLGDRVIFTAAGTGATGYAANVPYYVVTVVDANTFQLSATLGGPVLLSGADSAGTWTLARYSATDRAAQIENL